MSAERYLDLMEACRLNVEIIQAERGENGLTTGEMLKATNLRALVVGVHEGRYVTSLREIMWPSGATQFVQSRYLLPAKLTE